MLSKNIIDKQVNKLASEFFKDLYESNENDRNRALSKAYTQLAMKYMLDIDEEKRLQKATLAAIRSGLIHSAHDCSDGGLAIALAEMAINSVGSLGAEINAGFGDTAVQLFGEIQSRIVVSVQPEHIASIRVLCTENEVDCVEIGKVVFDTFTIGSLSTTVDLLREEYNSALENAVLG